MRRNRPHRVRGNKRPIGLRLLLLTFLGSSLVLTVVAPRQLASATDPGLHEVGVLDPVYWDTDAGAIGEHAHPSPLLIDAAHRVGFSMGVSAVTPESPSSYPTLTMFDLDRLKLLGTIRVDLSLARNLDAVRGWAVDVDAQRIYVHNVGALFDGQPCVPTRGQQLPAFDYRRVDADHWEISNSAITLPCVEGQNFELNQIYLDRVHGKAYMAGSYGIEGYRGRATPVPPEDDGQALIVAQFDMAKMKIDPLNSLDWHVDLRQVGCGRRSTTHPLLGRAGDNVLTYCLDGSFTGATGYVVRIPLDATHRPISRSGIPYQQGDLVADAEIHRIPALIGGASPSFDEVSGKVIIGTADPLNGSATWVFDPNTDRLVGVIASGDSAYSVLRAAVGADPQNGRVYMLTPGGVVVTQVRHQPLPAGSPPYPVLQRQTDRLPCKWDTATPRNPVPGTCGDTIAVLPGHDGVPTRIFVSIENVGWRVVDDDTPEVPDPAPTDLDSSTVWTTPDVPGTTEIEPGATGLASGLHVVSIGGLHRTVNNGAFAGSECNDSTSQQCEQYIASDDQEMYVAQSAVATATASTSSDAAGFAVPQKDTATTTDFKRWGLTDAGFPVAPSHCDDFGSGQTADAQKPSAGLPVDRASTAAVSCDAATNQGSSTASFGAVALPDAANPVVSVALVQSSTATIDDPIKGQVTIANSTARGITIGPVSIGEVISQATTSARGRDGTAHAEYHRQWCAISIVGAGSVPGCIDPDDPANRRFMDGINVANATAGRIWISAPAFLRKATPHGYTGFVTKDPDQADGDRAMNNDGSQTVPGLQVLIINDGFGNSSGRNRWVVQLANVHAESHYGVFPLSTATDGTGGDLPAVDSPLPAVDTAPTTDLTPPAPSAEVAPAPTVADQPVEVPRAIEDAAVMALADSVPVSSVRPATVQLPAPGRPVIERMFRSPGQALREAIHLLIQNPGAFGLLLALWGLLAAPLYLALRRRARIVALEL